MNLRTFALQSWVSSDFLRALPLKFTTDGGTQENFTSGGRWSLYGDSSQIC